MIHNNITIFQAPELRELNQTDFVNEEGHYAHIYLLNMI